MGSLLCEKRLYNVESVETAALDVQVIGVDFPTVPFISGEVERLEYVSPKQWEKRRLQAMAKKARLEMEKPRPKTSPYRYVLASQRKPPSPVHLSSVSHHSFFSLRFLFYRTRPGRKQSKERIPIISMERPGSERNLLKCTRVSLTIQKERESLTTPMQKNPRLSAPSRRDSRSMSWTERPSTSHAALGGEIPSVSVQIPDTAALGGPSPPLPSPPGGGSLIPPGAQPKRQAQHGAHHPQLAQTEAASAKDEPKDVQDQDEPVRRESQSGEEAASAGAGRAGGKARHPQHRLGYPRDQEH